MMTDPTSQPIDASLLASALQVLEQEGEAALSVAHVARRSGLFDCDTAASCDAIGAIENDRALRSELAALGFERLATALQSVEPSPDVNGDAAVAAMGPLFAAGRAYIQTATAQPRLFALLRSREQLDFDRPALRQASDTAFAALLAIVRRAQSAGFEPDRPLAELSQTIWDSVHRVAMRWADATLAAAAASGDIEAARIDESIELELTLLLAGPTESERA